LVEGAPCAAAAVADSVLVGNSMGLIAIPFSQLLMSRLAAAICSFLNGKAASRVLPPDIPIVKRSGPLILADRALDVHAP
jgi:hypothetical protein